MTAARVAVLGAGTMGNGIAQVFAQHGHPSSCATSTGDPGPRAGPDRERAWPSWPRRSRIAGEKEAALGRITAATDMAAVAEADLVVEAVVENLSVKTALFQELDRTTRPATILASNTSSISITKLGRPRAGRRRSSGCTS